MEPASPVTWPEVVAHLRENLYLDPEWTAESEGELTWQPSELPVHVSLIEEQRLPNDSPLLIVKAWTRILPASEEVGVPLAESATDRFPLGSVFWVDGYVVAACGVNVSGESRSNLSLLHVAVLALATAAHDLFADFGHESPELFGDERTLGRRDSPDELLNFFRAEVSNASGQERLALAWEAARPVVNRILTENGFDPGFTDPTVDFYSLRGQLSLGFSYQDDPGSLGPGVRVVAIATPPLDNDPPNGFVNKVNLMIHDVATAQIGHMHWVGTEQGWASGNVSAFLPWAYLGRYANHTDDLAAATYNALLQVVATASPVVEMFAED